MGATHLRPLQPGAPGPSQNIQTRPRAVQITADKVQPTLRLYTQDEDQFQLSVQSNIAGAQINFSFRWLMPDGQIVPQIVPVIAPVAGVIQFQTIAIPEGFLLTAAANAPNPLAAGQWVWADVALLRGGISGANDFDEIMAGYCAHLFNAAWPEWVPQRPSDGAGQIISITTANPAAGADFTLTVPTSRRWNLLSLRAVLSTSAAVANRNATLLVDDGANTFFSSPSGANIVASTNERIVASPDLPFINDGFATQTFPLANPTILRGGFRISSSTSGLQAADQWNSIQILALEWLDRT